MKSFFYLKILSILASVIFMFNSCRCSCDCEQAIGCRTFVARDINTGDTIIIKKFCSNTSVYRDWAVVDSVSDFYGQYSSPTSFVESSDSVANRNRIENIKCDETDFYANQKFYCECYK